MSTLDDTGRSPGEIIVGVDGSEHSRSALLWAVDQAGLTGARLRAVATYTPEIPATTVAGVPAMPPHDYRPEAILRQTIDTFIRDTLGDDRGNVALSVVQGPAGRVLTEAADGADLLVVGSHGHGTVRDVLLGSTSKYCIHHATCPVLVVRTPDT